MSDLSTFQIVAGSASIIALLITVVGLTGKSIRTYKRKRKEAEQELEQELSRLRAAGGTVSARTDLGFFVVMKLGSLRDLIHHLRHQIIYWLVLTMFFAVAPAGFSAFCGESVSWFWGRFG